MSEAKQWILEAIDSLQSNKTRPDFQRISARLKRMHGLDPDCTRAELKKLIQEKKVREVHSKGSISYWNAAKRKSVKKHALSCEFMGEQAKHGSFYSIDSSESFMDYEASHSSFNNSATADSFLEYEDQELQGDKDLFWSEPNIQEHLESQDSSCTMDIREGECSTECSQFGLSFCALHLLLCI